MSQGQFAVAAEIDQAGADAADRHADELQFVSAIDFRFAPATRPFSQASESCLSAGTRTFNPEFSAQTSEGPPAKPEKCRRLLKQNFGDSLLLDQPLSSNISSTARTGAKGCPVHAFSRRA
jgi:hypothetical protein